LGKRDFGFTHLERGAFELLESQETKNGSGDDS